MPSKLVGRSSLPFKQYCSIVFQESVIWAGQCSLGSAVLVEASDCVVFLGLFGAVGLPQSFLLVHGVQSCVVRSEVRGFSSASNSSI